MKSSDWLIYFRHGAVLGTQNRSFVGNLDEGLINHGEWEPIFSGIYIALSLSSWKFHSFTHSVNTGVADDRCWLMSTD